MNNSKKNLLSAVILFSCSLAASAPAACAAGWDKALKEALQTKYEITKFGTDYVRITKPGTVLVVQQDGIYVTPSTNYNVVASKVVAGKVEGPKGWAAAMLTTDEQNSRNLRAGERVYVESIVVVGKEVRFRITTCNTSDVNVSGNTRTVRYTGAASFEFSKGFLESADAAAVEKVVNAVLLPESEVQSSKTRTIELGQTPDQVKSALGAPDKIIKLGPKEIYVYKDMKVVFVDGKVSDVQ
jgi:hypothetical protein